MKRDDIRLISLFMVVIAMFLLSGCAVKEEPKSPTCSLETKQCSDGSMISRDPANNCEYPACPEVTTQQTTQVETKPAKVANDQAVETIIAKIADVKSYEYLDSKTGLVTLVMGDKKVFITSDPNKWAFKVETYNTIYQDDAEKLAFAACVAQPDIRKGFSCGKNLKTYTVITYPTVEFEDPFADFSMMEGAKVTGSQTCESRQCDVIEYTKEGKKYRMFARKTYVLPYKIWELDEDGKESLLVTYSNPSFNGLKDSEMGLAKDLVLMP